MSKATSIFRVLFRSWPIATVDAVQLDIGLWGQSGSLRLSAKPTLLTHLGHWLGGKYAMIPTQSCGEPSGSYT